MHLDYSTLTVCDDVTPPVVTPMQPCPRQTRGIAIAATPDAVTRIGDSWQVKGSRGAIYTVSFEQYGAVRRLRCDCQDFAIWGARPKFACKHVHSVRHTPAPEPSPIGQVFSTQIAGKAVPVRVTARNPLTRMGRGFHALRLDTKRMVTIPSLACLHPLDASRA